MTSPVVTCEPRSTPMDFTKPFTLGYTATVSYASSWPGIDSITSTRCATTRATSTATGVPARADVSAPGGWLPEQAASVADAATAVQRDGFMFDARCGDR